MTINMIVSMVIGLVGPIVGGKLTAKKKATILAQLRRLVNWLLDVINALENEDGPKIAKLVKGKR